ncbi:hypothetical protein Acsp03_44980 [Actinomadura sp. NBRC 104412]|nr:DUF397 domain-containing protein [Actinomadura sp. NBRC 104412]GLZ07032.1 hypothetical protein Acsp03_44980 [Actinomadura sp. NBRC 104412]
MENLKWRKSSYSDSSGGQCVEVAALPHGIAVRDSKNPDGAKLRLDRDAFAAFLAHVRK